MPAEPKERPWQEVKREPYQVASTKARMSLEGNLVEVLRPNGDVFLMLPKQAQEAGLMPKTEGEAKVCVGPQYTTTLDLSPLLLNLNWSPMSLNEATKKEIDTILNQVSAGIALGGAMPKKQNPTQEVTLTELALAKKLAEAHDQGSKEQGKRGAVLLTSQRQKFEEELISAENKLTNQKRIVTQCQEEIERLSANIKAREADYQRLLTDVGNYKTKARAEYDTLSKETKRLAASTGVLVDTLRAELADKEAQVGMLEERLDKATQALEAAKKKAWADGFTSADTEAAKKLQTLYAKLDVERQQAYNRGIDKGFQDGLADSVEHPSPEVVASLTQEGYSKGFNAGVLAAEKERVRLKGQEAQMQQDIYDEIIDAVSSRVGVSDKLDAILERVRDEAFSEGFDEGFDAQEEVEMSETKSTLEVALDEGAEVTTRLAAKQLMKLLREPLVAAICGHLGQDDPSMRAKVGAFLDSDLGKGLLTGCVSLGLMALPKGMAPAQVTALVGELRVSALTDIGDSAVDLLMKPLRQVMCNFFTPEVLAALPQESAQARVSVPVEVAVTEPATVSQNR